MVSYKFKIIFRKEANFFNNKNLGSVENFKSYI